MPPLQTQPNTYATAFEETMAQMKFTVMNLTLVDFGKVTLAGIEPATF